MNTITINEKVSIIASKQSWIEGQAISQLQGTAKLEGMQKAVGMPDLHPGRGNPVGAAFVTKGKVYPYLVGGDIGCGKGLWQTNLKTRKMKRDKWTKKLKGLDEPWYEDRERFLREHQLDYWDEALGTIGGGNHFAELQQVHEVFHEKTFESYKLKKDLLQLMVHSGSRGLGQVILKKAMKQKGFDGFNEGSSELDEYIAQHNHAQYWASCNRVLIARRFLNCINAEGKRIVDLCHNSVTKVEGGWLHRKGAAPAWNKLVLIPGSRGHLSYIVKPIGDQSKNAWSLAHGAGRKYNRSDCKKRFSHRYKVDDLKQTKLGSKVICDDKQLLYEEAPDAYKDINQVIQDLLDANLIKLVASLSPVITYKTSK